MREAPAVDEALCQSWLAQLRIVRPKTVAVIVRRDGNDAAVVQHVRDPEIVHQRAVVKFAALGRLNIEGIGARPGRDFLPPINNGRADPECRRNNQAWQKRGVAKERDDSWSDDKKREDEQNNHDISSSEQLTYRRERCG